MRRKTSDIRVTATSTRVCQTAARADMTNEPYVRTFQEEAARRHLGRAKPEALI